MPVRGDKMGWWQFALSVLVFTGSMAFASGQITTKLDSVVESVKNIDSEIEGINSRLRANERLDAAQQKDIEHLEDGLYHPTSYNRSR